MQKKEKILRVKPKLLKTTSFGGKKGQCNIYPCSIYRLENGGPDSSQQRTENAANSVGNVQNAGGRRGGGRNLGPRGRLQGRRHRRRVQEPRTDSGHPGDGATGAGVNTGRYIHHL